MPIPTKLLVRITSRLVSAREPADAAGALAVWETLFGKLVPLLGPLSNELLFARSLIARQAAFPWLPQFEPGAEGSAFSVFRSALGGRTPEDIVAVNQALLEAYTSALADLIGMQLSVHLLNAVFPGDEANQNTLENSHDRQS